MKLLIFTDLDGTLLDHHDYGWDPAKPALAALERVGAPVILASSKTAAELQALHARLGLSGYPVIAENGAVAGDPAVLAGGGGDYAALRAAIAGLPGARDFRGFGDMTAAEVSRATGLPPKEAALARRRQHSEPGLWQGAEAELEVFLKALGDAGLSARQGGRFLTISRGATKAGRMAEIAAGFGPDKTVALGDAPNDREMIEAADFGVIVRNDDGPGLPDLPGEATGRVFRTVRSGPEGWNEAILGILDDLNLSEDADG